MSNHSSRFKKDRIHTKKKTYGYKERDEKKRLEFLEKVSEKPLSSLVYVDESGIEDTEEYAYGYCLKGERFHALKSGSKTIRQYDCRLVQ